MRTDVFLAQIDAMLGMESLLPEAERSRGRAFSSQRRSREFIAGRVLLRLAMSFGRPVPPGTWRFRVVDGKPVAGWEGAPGFSLSHSGGWVGCAVASAGGCGFDLQRIADRAFREIAEAFFPAHEAEWLDRQSRPDSAFFCLWTLKEAWAKASGLALLPAMREACFVPAPGMQAVPDWQAHAALLAEDMAMAWISEGDDPAWRGWRWDGAGFSPFRPATVRRMPMYQVRGG